MPTLDLDPGEVTILVRGLPLRQELVYRLAIRRLSARCRGDRQFRRRTEDLTTRFKSDLPAILSEVTALSDALVMTVAEEE
jgi:hypothetical protein